MTTDVLDKPAIDDAGLVAETLNGNRKAFCQIVERYQTLISSVAYCATGNVSQSEDLAQETFVSAWKQLPYLREPAKLRSWLCGITRYLISKEFRRLGREPVHAAESLDTVDEWTSPEPLPPDHVIGDEEKAILWRSLERIPEIYREPLVLFYREHQSIEAVAHDLGLSEDAVKQRLSRGRKLLQEQFLAFVAGALKQTNPGKTFTLGVMAALPLLATTAKAATATAAVTKGGSAAKAVTGAGVFGAFLTAGTMLLLSLYGVFGFVGRLLGRKMGRASQQSPLGRRRIIQFWRTLAIGFVVLVLPALFFPFPSVASHAWFFRAQTWSLLAFYWLVAASWAVWIWQRYRDSRRRADEAQNMKSPSARSYNTWVLLGTLGPACILGLVAYDMFGSNHTWSSNAIPEVEAQKIISERADAQFTVLQYKDGAKTLEIRLPDDRRISKRTVASDSLVSAMTAKGIAYQTLVEDRDFHNGGVQGWLVLLSTFIVVAGAVLLLRRPGTSKFYTQETVTPQAERREKRILAFCAGLAMIALGLLIFVFTISHYSLLHSQSISSAAAAKIISEPNKARFEVFQYANGSKDLWIGYPGSVPYPRFITPADEATLALLAEKKIPCKTYVQGRDFGYGQPSQWLLWPLIIALSTGAVFLFKRALRKDPDLAATAGSSL